jgi:hypothetical protein
MPLHGDKGGPVMCIRCGMDWHVEHARRRKAGRIIIKAMRAYEAVGGRWSDFRQLSLVAAGIPLPGYDADTLGADVGDITSELLADAIQLTHPDKHPPERRALAQRVTQELLALKPFVFPALKPKPVVAAPPRDGSIKSPLATLKKPSPDAYPCEVCVNEVPYYYCSPCRTEFLKRQNAERDRRNATQRAQYARRRARSRRQSGPRVCARCRSTFEPKRKDAKYCSAKCRQEAHRLRCNGKTKLQLASGNEPSRVRAGA